MKAKYISLHNKIIWLTSSVTFLCGFRKHIFIPIFFLLSISSCTPSSPTAVVKDGKTYGVTRGLFNHRWWNYYERGNSFAEGEFWKEAESDFIEAIKKRNKDQRRARTYGMHFLDYFPHRDLGIVYYKTGRYSEAIKELEESLKNEESAKAIYFYNKARGAIVSRKNLDATPPHLLITTPESGLITNNPSINITGVAIDDTFVSTIYFNSKPLFIELSEKKLHFTQTISLHQGSNVLSLKAVDITGKETKIAHEVILDLSAPFVSIENVVKQSDDAWLVTGHVTDENSIEFFSLNGKEKLIPRDTHDIPFGERVEGNRLHFIVKDLAGNVSEESLELSAYNDRDEVFSLKQTRVVSLMDARDAAAMVFAAVKRQEQLPHISLKNLSENQDTFLDKLFLEGSLSGSDTIVSGTINGVQLDFKPGKRVYFNHLVQLQEGANKIVIAASNSKGKTASKKILINRQIPAAHSIGSRMTLAVIPFSKTGELNNYTALSFNLFQTRLNERKRFHLVMRKDFDRILEELRLSQTKLVDPGTAARVGKIVVADKIVTGAVFQQKNAIEVTINVVNTETSSLMASLDVFSEKADMYTINYLMEGLTLKLEKAFPLLEGLIIKIKRGKYYLDLGEQKGIKPEMQLVAFRDNEPLIHPITGKVLGADTEILGRLTVTGVHEDYSVAEVWKEEHQQIRQLDKFITR